MNPLLWPLSYPALLAILDSNRPSVHVPAASTEQLELISREVMQAFE